jgi:triphosphatase
MEGTPLTSNDEERARASGEHAEIEWQFEATALPRIERWLASQPFAPELAVIAGTRRVLRDTYVDTDDWRFYRAGFALRLRATGNDCEATLKSFGTHDDGPRRRREITEPAPDADAEALRGLEGPVGERVRALAGTSRLVALFQVRTRRRSFDLMRGDERVGEIALDATAIARGSDRPARLSRVEVEATDRVDPAVEAVVAAFRDVWSLTPAATSKFALGVAVHELEPPTGAPDLGPTAITTASSAGEVAFAALRTDFAAVLANELGTRLGEDPEPLHDMRVAIRRLRVALKIFADVLPARGRRFRDSLGALAKPLGETRDLDVQLAELARRRQALDPRDAEALAPLFALLRRRRDDARRRMLAALDARSYTRLVESMSAFLRAGPAKRQPAARAAILGVGPRLVRRRYKKLKRRGAALGADSPAEDWHALRIQTKRLRYTLEFHEPIYGKAARTLIDPLVDLQDLLGEHQDAEIAASSLRALCQNGLRELAPATAFAIGELAQAYVQRAAELRDRFPKLYRKVRGRRWKRLRRAVERDEPADTAGAAATS